MTEQIKIVKQKTTIWKTKNGETILIMTLPGLPYGTSNTVFIEGVGEAIQSGVQSTGSGNNKSIVEVKYTIK